MPAIEIRGGAWEEDEGRLVAVVEDGRVRASEGCGADCACREYDGRPVELAPLGTTRQGNWGFRCGDDLVAPNAFVSSRRGPAWIERGLDAYRCVLARLNAADVPRLVRVRRACDCCTVMEYLDGYTVFDNRSPWTPPQHRHDCWLDRHGTGGARPVIESLVATVARLHLAGVAHTDVVGHNVLIGSRGELRLVDLMSCVPLAERRLIQAEIEQMQAFLADPVGTRGGEGVDVAAEYLKALDRLARATGAPAPVPGDRFPPCFASPRELLELARAVTFDGSTTRARTKALGPRSALRGAARSLRRRIRGGLRRTPRLRRLVLRRREGPALRDLQRACRALVRDGAERGRVLAEIVEAPGVAQAGDAAPRRSGPLRPVAEGAAPEDAARFLEVALEDISARFEAGAAGLPATLDPADPRAERVREFLGVEGDLRVLDAGCGRGRYLRYLLGVAPQHCYAGVDVSPTACAMLPVAVDRKAGSLLRIPFEDARFDRTFCVESLEHSVLPKDAVRELCRVTRPGGRVLIIDKNVDALGWLEMAPWEQWFRGDEVCDWLSAWCGEVSCETLRGVPGDGGLDLYLTWTGRRLE